MKLLLDIGNTNAKWAWFGDQLFGFGEYTHVGARVEEVVAAIVSEDRQPDGIWIAGVAGALVDALGRALELDYGVTPTRVNVVDNAYGLKLGYRYPDRLGVDRWLAMIAVRAGCVGTACVADLGTALTVDGLLEDGTHIGGAISPGIEMMERAILVETAEVGRRAIDDHGSLTLFADDTAAAVRAGAVYSAVGLIERAAAELDEIADEPATLFLTGGSAGMIAPLIARDVHVLRELVLRGLARVVQDSAETVEE